MIRVENKQFLKTLCKHFGWKYPDGRFTYVDELDTIGSGYFKKTYYKCMYVSGCFYPYVYRINN
jgi:hypothetical protein